MALAIVGLAIVGLTSLATPRALAADVPEVSPSPASSGAPQSIVQDPFDPPTDGSGAWWTGSDELGTSTYAGGGLRWTLVGDNVIWDTISLPAEMDRVRVAADVLVEEGSGGGGPVCGAGDGDEGRFLWAGINGDGEWLVGRIVGSHLQVAERGDLPRIRMHDVPVGAPYALRVTLECVTDPLGVADHATVWIEDVQVADIDDQPVGPYSGAGLTAAGDGGPFAILFDDFAVAAMGEWVAPSAAPKPASSDAVLPGPSASP